jgi:hypothetical protein
MEIINLQLIHVEDEEKIMEEQKTIHNKRDMIINKYFSISENNAYIKNKLASRIDTRNYSRNLMANNGRISETSLLSINESRFQI